MQKAIIDLSKNGIIPVFHAKQGDTSRRIAITLLDNGLPYDTAADAVSVWYCGPSGEGNYSDGIDKDGSTLTILVNPNMTAASGRHTCAVMLSNESGRCTTWNFCVEVAYTPALGSEEAKAYFEAFDAGELAADIAALDARTAKAVAELNARVSAIIASGTATEGNTELIDIRTGANGKLYQTAGDAVRGQIGALSAVDAELRGDLALVEKISLGESDVYYKNITDVSVINYVKTISGINAQSVTFYPQADPLDGKKLAARLTLSDGTIKYEAVTENKKYAYDGLTISEICIYVEGNYLTSPCIVSGQICIDTDKKPLIKRIEQTENNIKQLEVDSDNDYIKLNNNCKQSTLGILTFNTGKWIDSNGVLNNGSSSDGYTDYFRVYKGQTVYIYGNSWAGANLISFYDDNKNFVSGEAGTGKAIESSFEVEHDGYVRLCINTNIIPISNVYSFVMNPADNYIIDKLRPVQDDWVSSKFDEITTKYRFIALTFQDYYQNLNLIGSNDFFDSAYKIKQNVFVPQLGRKTLRDPSWMYYKGYFYIVYTVEATKEDSLITDTDFDEIGVVRTKDFITFYECPHIHLSDSEHKFITHIWAPAFCVLDNKPYILTWARTSDDYGSFLFEYNPKTNETKFIKKMNNMNLDTHIYKVNDSYYSVGNGDNEKGIKIMKSPTLTGDYTKIAELATSAYFEGAYLIPKDDGTWRILMKGENGYYWSDSSTSELDSTWTNPVAVEKDFTWVEQHLTVIDMLNVDYNQLT